MTTVVVSPTGVVRFPQGGGHWWVYLQYVLALQELGCDVWWLERVPAGSVPADLATPLARLEQFGLAGRVLCYEEGRDRDGLRWLTGTPALAARLISRTELLINFDYGAPAELVRRFRRSVLVDIDPGLLQQWITTGQVHPAPHDRWFTTGETVGTDRASFPDGGRTWEHIRPVVHLASWPPQGAAGAGGYTTVTSWWGDEWVAGEDGSVYENNKRVTFLEYADLPRRTGLPLELAAYFGGAASPGSEVRDVEPECAGGDADDVRRMRAGGWRLRRSAEVTGDPWAYRRYVQDSRGEFSCVKPSCLAFQNAWISDRTLCYLASGRPAVVQDTGPSEFLPEGEGLLRFSSVEQAADALARVEADHRRHASAARAIAEAHFDAVHVLARLLDLSLSAGPTTAGPTAAEATSTADATTTGRP